GLPQFPRTEPDGAWDGSPPRRLPQFPRTASERSWAEDLAGARRAADADVAFHNSLEQVPTVRGGRPAAGRSTIPANRGRRRALAAVVAGLVLATVPAAGQAPDRSTRPPIGPVPTVDLPEPQRFTLENGLDVVV